MSAIDAVLRARLEPVGDWQPSARPRAAVLCPLVEHGDRDQVLLLVRPSGLRQHAGQIAFPGGKAEAGESATATALRECREEIGVTAERISLLGQLTTRYSSSGMSVHALVARLRPGPLRLAADEVVRILHVPLHELRDELRWQELPPPAGATGSQPRTSPHFRAGDDVIWGLTGRFLRELVAVLNAR